MSKVEQLSITLPSEHARLIRPRMADGRYGSESEIVSEAVQLWQDVDDRHRRSLDTVKRKIAEADADPRPSLFEDEVERHFMHQALR